MCPSYMKLLTSISWEHPSLVLLGFMLVPDPSPRDLAFSCAGVEYHERGRCELWNRSIESSLTLMPVMELIGWGPGVVGYWQDGCPFQVVHVPSSGPST